MKGRKKIPREIKEIQGTARADRENFDRPTFPIVAPNSPMPEMLTSEYEQGIYRQIMSDYGGLGIIQTPDMPLLIAYCQQMGLYLKVMNQLKDIDSLINENPQTGSQQPSALFKVAAKSLEMAKQIAVLFGITPAEREKLKIGKVENKKETSEYDEI